MANWLKITALATGLLFSGTALIALLFDPDDFKAELSEFFKQHWNADLAIEGDMQLAVFPWLALSTGKLVLRSPADLPNRPFISISEARAGVKLWSLFTRQPEISEIIVKGAEVNLSINAQGIANWQTWQNSSPVNEPSAALPFLGSLLQGITIENARLNWDDQMTAQHYQLERINIKTGPITPDKPFFTEASLRVLDKSGNSWAEIHLTGNLLINPGLSRVRLHQLDVDLNISRPNAVPKSLPVKLIATELMVDIPAQSVKGKALQIKLADIYLTTDLEGSFKQSPKLAGPFTVRSDNLAKSLRQLAIDLPNMPDQNVLTGFSGTGKLQATADQISLTDLKLKVDDSSLKGTLTINPGPSLTTAFNLSIDQFNMDRYRAPNQEQVAESPIAPVVGLAKAATAVPVSSLQKLKAKGTITIARLTVNGLMVNEVSLALDSDDPAIKSLP